MPRNTHTRIFQGDHSDAQAQSGEHYDTYLPFVAMAC